MKVAPFGGWESPITSALLVEAAVGLSGVVADGERIYWTESRPTEAGRQVVVRRDPDGRIADVIPAGYSARTTVHEYGGLAVAASGGVLWFSNQADQRMHRLAPGAGPLPITPEPPSPAADRYAAPVVGSGWLVCVRERHRDDGVHNELVRVDADGRTEPVVVAEGHDFYAAPTLSPEPGLSPNSRRLAWLSWDHPRMPWDGNELWEAPIDDAGELGPPRRVAGGPTESISQPRYAPDGTLWFVSDRTGWWNLYRDGVGDDGEGTDGDGTAQCPMQAELSLPDWVFGQSRYQFLDDGTIVAVWSVEGIDHLGLMPPASSQLVEIPTRYTTWTDLARTPAGIAAIAASATEAPAVVEVRLEATTEPEIQVLRRSRERTVDPRYISVPQPITFESAASRGGPPRLGHALYYPPTNPDFTGPPGEAPPLIVASHGGPTSAARPILSYPLQFWTSRGFAVVDVDYGGSSGYGRAYRRLLDGQWGVVDVEDCVAAAKSLVAKGAADPDRLLIHGGSAGGYTTLCALTFTDLFAAGASHFGVADVAALARDTHKFEARYLDSLIGPWPDAEDVYRERSPLFHTDQLRTPLILFQGTEDRVVPPDQAQTMADALERHGVPHCLVLYQGEHHGFRQAEHIMHAADAELAFYGRILGFVPAGPPVELDIVGAVPG